MDSLISVVLTSPAPVLVALLAGLVFLSRASLQPLNLNNKPLKERSKSLSPTLEDTQFVSKESEFPENWLVGNDIFELEKRAIFSKNWLYLFHRSRFTKAGDYQSFEVAGFPIFLILGKDGEVRAFHNVCRHRAFPVTKKECGSTTVLGCRYHGWSYNTNGQLIKAPYFDHVPGFDKEQNSLFAIHTFQTTTGFIFINLETGPTVDAVETKSLDAFASRNAFESQSRWIGGQTVEGGFNWKMGLRAQEFIDAERLKFETSQLIPPSLVAKLIDYLQKRNSENITLFPNTSLHTIKGTRYWYSLSFHPVSEQKTLIRYDLYCSQNTSDPQSQLVSEKLVELIDEHIRELETEYQTHPEERKTYVSVASDFSPNKTDMQRDILSCLKAHAKLEKTRGTEVYPAMRKPRMNAKFEQADQLCRSLDCQGSQIKGLAW